MGKLCGGAHEIAGIKAPIFLHGSVGGGGMEVVGWVVVGWGWWVGWVLMVWGGWWWGGEWWCD